MKLSLYLPAISVLFATCFAGCGGTTESLPPGNISISWLMGSSGCQLLDIETVVISLESSDSAKNFSETAACDAGSSELEDIEPGSYSLILTGHDAEETTRFQGDAGQIEVRSGGTITVPTVQLSALPSTISVTWYFENGRMCGHNEIETVDITLFDNEHLLSTEVSPCADGIYILENILSGDYVVDILARDVDGVAQFSGQESIEIDRGDFMEIEVVLMEVDLL
jgi:hypothetical protein